MSTYRPFASAILALAVSTALSGCGSSSTATTTTTTTTQQFLFTPTTAAISALPVTGGVFGTPVQTATATGTTSNGVTTIDGSTTLYSSESANTVEVYGIGATGGLAAVGSDGEVFGSSSTETAGALALNGSGSVLYVAGSNGDIEALSAASTAVTGVTPSVSGGLAAVTTTTTVGATPVTPDVVSLQVITVGTASILVAAESSTAAPLVQAFLLNSDGSFASASATSTLAVGSGTNATGASVYTAANGNVDLAVSTNGTTDNIGVVTLSSAGTLTPVSTASGEFNLASSDSTEALEGIYVTGSLAFALGSAGDVQSVPVNTDGSLSANVAAATTLTVGSPLAGGIVADGVDFFVTGSSDFLVDGATDSPTETTTGTALQSTGGGAQSTITF